MQTAGLTLPRMFLIFVVLFCGFFLLLGFFIDLPTWIVFGSGYLIIFLLSLSALIGLIMKKRAGKLLLPPVPADKSRPLRIIAGLLWIASGYLQLTRPFNIVFLHSSSAAASHQMLYILLIFMGIFQILGADHVHISQQIAEHGILDNSGTFYAWASVESFVWERAVGRLIFKLKPSLGGKRVSVENIPFEIRPEIYPYLEERINGLQSMSK